MVCSNSVLKRDWFGNEQLHATPLSNISDSRVNGGEPVAAVQNDGSFAYVYRDIQHGKLMSGVC